MDEWPYRKHVHGSAQNATSATWVAISRSLGTISSSRCQTTRECFTCGAKQARIRFSRNETEVDDRWWSQTESNRRPPACKAGALPTELWPRTREYAVKSGKW